MSKKKDPWLVGYQFTYSAEKNPYDFITNLDTGMRPDAFSKPSGVMATDLRPGINGVTIPPLQTWKEGQWLCELDEGYFGDGSTTYSGIPTAYDPFDTWVVDAEGTPGNLRWRAYMLPEEISRLNLSTSQIPKHPMMWNKKLKDGTKKDWTAHTGSGYSYGGSWDGWKTSDTKSTTTTAAKGTGTLPAGTRIRCTSCGHWFRVDDLDGHIQCCPQVNQFTDWAIKCECCASMDDTATVKEGYPRDFHAGPSPDTTGEVTADGGSEPIAERASGDTPDTEGSGVAV